MAAAPFVDEINTEGCEKFQYFYGPL